MLHPAGARGEAVVPDACLDFLFDLTDPGDARLVGTMTRPLTVSRAGEMDLLGVRFRPGAVAAFADVPAHEVTDDIVALDVAWGLEAHALFERLREAPGTAERVALLDRTLVRRLGECAGVADPVALAAAGLVERTGGRIRIDDLARSTGLGRRQLERRFLAAVGIPPKTACRVVRFQNALARMHADPGASLSRVALLAGYHDQAHLTRDFGAFAGEPPGAYRARRGLTGDDAFLQDPNRGRNQLRPCIASEAFSPWPPWPAWPDPHSHRSSE